MPVAMSAARTNGRFDGNAALQQPLEEQAKVPSALDEVVARVRQDAEHDPKTFARDAEVPNGGE